MAKSSGQKLKLLYLMDFFLRRTDQEHPAAVPQMLEYLHGCGVEAERKSIYDDIEALRLYGLDIEQRRGPGGGYYLASRDFELAELKLLVDSVQSSRFITHKKSLSLIAKLSRLAGEHDARQLQRQVYVTGRIKSMNESIYYAVDDIHSAIAQDRQISFKYSEYSVTKERVFRRGGERYVVSPFALTMSDGNYYLLAYEQGRGMRHYRVDRMAEMRVLEDVRAGKEDFAAIDMAEQSSKVFGMFSGTERTVKLRFHSHLAGAVIDRFGRDVPLIPVSDGRFTATVRVVVSPQFFGWLCGFGTEVELLEPYDVRGQFSKYAADIAGMYM